MLETHGAKLSWKFPCSEKRSDINPRKQVREDE